MPDVTASLALATISMTTADPPLRGFDMSQPERLLEDEA
jgi:hypothetical protein